MVYGQRRQTIPSNSDYSLPQVKMLIRQVEAVIGRKVTAEEWERL